MNFWEILALFSSALAAGAINAVAGGGTLLTFPALLFTGTGAVVANATSSFALTMGTAGSLFGYRKQWATTRIWLRRFVPVSIVFSLLGSWLVKSQGEATFIKVVPWLLLFATILFLAQGPLKKWRERKMLLAALAKQTPETPAGSTSGETSGDIIVNPAAESPAPEVSGRLDGATLSVAACVGLQAGVALYGGYFGAGIGILMLAVMGFMGMADIHKMNALKNMLALVINGTAALFFAATGLVDWPRMAIMLVGAVIGYWLGAHFSQKIPQAAVRGIVVAVGLVISGAMFWKVLSGG
ncbi:MAG: sulfite exporter TauE/SafE family protein [Verrucomicrobiales bacterium]|nr:sulfite exporter TauE/SafE family protein [Verrucomicrobiales bacterium]